MAHRKRVLLVDKESNGAEAIQALLEAWGHEVTPASTGQEGVRLALQCAPEIVLVDIGLPDVDGRTVARTIRARVDPPPMLVALTNRDCEPGDAELFDAYIMKSGVDRLRSLLDNPAGPRPRRQ